MTATGHRARGEPEVTAAGNRLEAGKTEILSDDTLLDGRVRLTQPATGYRAGIDPVLLAAAVAARPGDRVLDLGAGAGAASLCLAVRVTGVTVDGLEIDPRLVQLARSNAARSGVAPRTRFTIGDLLAPPPALSPETFDHVMANPPHLVNGAVRLPADPARAAAMVEGNARLPRWIDRALLLTRPGGTVTVVHRADRLDALFSAMGSSSASVRVGEISVFPLWPGDGRPAKRVIVSGRKGSRGPTCLLPGLVLHGAGRRFTPEAQAVLRDGASLKLRACSP